MTEHEELLMLRAMVEKQKAELKAKDQIIQKQNIRKCLKRWRSAYSNLNCYTVTVII